MLMIKELWDTVKVTILYRDTHRYSKYPEYPCNKKKQMREREREQYI